jgi:hypothetical protein
MLPCVNSNKKRQNAGCKADNSLKKNLLYRMAHGSGFSQILSNEVPDQIEIYYNITLKNLKKAKINAVNPQKMMII